MTRNSLAVTLAVMAAWLHSPAHAQRDALRIVSSGPNGVLSQLEQANEIRIVFSEPMVSLGRIPDQVAAPFVRIVPAADGSFRWSGTTLLIFTPDPTQPLPYATNFEVNVDTTATAVSGRKLARPETFRFTTPPVQLLQTDWYRRDGTVNSPMVVLLRFNQPVRPADVLAHLAASLQRHEWSPPAFSREELDRYQRQNPAALGAFNTKVAATRQVAAGGGRIALRHTDNWAKDRFPASPDLVVFETATPVLPESWVRLELDTRLPSPAGPAIPGGVQTHTIQAEPAFFVEDFRCTNACDADAWNPLRLRTAVNVADFAAALRATDITSGAQPVRKAQSPRPRQEYEPDQDEYLTLEDAGYSAQLPDRRFLLELPATLKSVDGQTLGYHWLGEVDNWHMRAFSSFGDGHGVWEKDGGPVLPFNARNLVNVRQWAAPLAPSELMPRLLELEKSYFKSAPAGDGLERRLGVTADRVQAHGLDLSSALGSGGTGLVWAAIRDGDMIPRSRRYNGDEQITRATLVQVTNLGITVKDSPQNTLIFVTRLDNGAPVDGATVSIVGTDNSTVWRGTTDANGLVMGPGTRMRDPQDWWRLSFAVIAEKDGDVAYTASNWNEGIQPWSFGMSVNLNERDPILRGSVFADRGVYRLGEEVHFKAILRHNTPTGIRLLPEGTSLLITVRNSENRVVEERVVRASAWSSAEWTMRLPDNGSLGNYSVRAILESDRPKPPTPEEHRTLRYLTGFNDQYVPPEKAVHGSFLVAAYRRPDFRVDVALTGDTTIAGETLRGVVTSRYLFGAAIGARPVSWSYRRSRAGTVPAAITTKFGTDRWVFLHTTDEENYSGDSTALRREQTTLSEAGDLPLNLDTTIDAGVPYVYSLEADVEDVSRQHIANRASLTVHPAPWYIGLRQPGYFQQQKDGLRPEIIAAGLDGAMVSGIPVEVTLTQVQWNSVRRAEGNGFYTWDTERREIPAGKWNVVTGADPISLDIPFASGGYFILQARGQGEQGRFALASTSFYVLGEGYTAWARYDHNRIDLVPERKLYAPGDTARIMIQSPWEQATALVTKEREGIRSHERFTLNSTQQSVSIPITEEDIPNVYVSVLLVKGRSGRSTAGPVNAGSRAADAATMDNDASDPGKPAFRLGYIELRVEDSAKRLKVEVAAEREEYRPAGKAKLHVNVKDRADRGVASEVTLWAVDYGVLSLTDYRPPDVADSVYVRKSLAVFTQDSRQRIVSRRVLTPKGETEGGGGGMDAGAGTLRKDFRVLAFWLGSVQTSPDGTASLDVTLPESLTTYRIMAVAADRDSRFGSDDAEIRTSKPLTLRPSFPRFLSVGDSAFFGAVLSSQLRGSGSATVTVRSLDPQILEFPGAAPQRLTLPSGSTQEVRFSGRARAVGRARIQMAARMNNESDAFEDVIPVEILSSPETVAAYGEAAGAKQTATESLIVPTGVVPGFGGLNVELASTALVGLNEGARYLVEYPYGCIEQKASATLALLLATDVGGTFALPGMDPPAMRAEAQKTLKELEQFQCPDGGFAYWPGACWPRSAYLTSYVLHVFQTAQGLGYEVNSEILNRGYDFLTRELAALPPNPNEGWWPAYTAWQAFAVKVLTEGKRNQDSAITRLYGYRDRMPVFALAYLHDAMLARGESSGARTSDLARRLSNAIMPEAGSAHVEELADPYLLWFWNSNIRSTAIVLNSFVKSGAASGAGAPMREMVRWLIAARKQGRWGNTQENAHALEALVTYYKTYESTVPNFRATVSLGRKEILKDQFRGRSTAVSSASLPLAQVTAARPRNDAAVPLVFKRDGQGTLYYTARLRYATDAASLRALDAGFIVERKYEPYVEKGSRPAASSFAAGDLVRVTLTFRLTKERRFVAVTDPLPAGFEAVESWFATTARELAVAQDRQSNEGGDAADWRNWWRHSGFDRVERHDDRVQLFATRLSEGAHEFSYIIRATTAGSFRAGPAHAEEMYEPEVFGSTSTDAIEVKR